MLLIVKMAINTTKRDNQKQAFSPYYGCQRGGVRGRESQVVWDGHVHTAIFKMVNPQGPTG